MTQTHHNKMKDIRVNTRFVFFAVIFLVIFIVYLTTNKKCDEHKTNKISITPYQELPTIFAVTPTYSRPVQKAELTRLSQTIMLVPNVHWILVEDAVEKSLLVKNLLIRTGLITRSTQLNVKTPDNFKLKGKDPNWSKPRGVEQRNMALSWIRHYSSVNPNLKSVVYFMDDDNSYSIDLFKEISTIEQGRVGVWPVGLVGGLKVEKPLLDSKNKVIGFNSAWRPDRPFPIDMAGFAISTDLLIKNPDAIFSFNVQRGFQETEILRHVTVRENVQPLANLCTEVLVWHTRTEQPKLDAEKKLEKNGEKSDLNMEV